MKSFLLNKENKPTLPWGSIPQGFFFEGPIPENYHLAVAPSENMVILDVDVKNGKNGYSNIPTFVMMELEKTFNYETKSGGGHYFMIYTGNKKLINRATSLGLDLRIGPRNGNCGGYVKYYHNVDIRECEHLIKETSLLLNTWLEKLFS
jgi:hypothetical protein